MRVKVCIARFPGRLSEHPASSNWAWRTYEQAKADPRVSEVLMWDQSDTPITMVRNLCLENPAGGFMDNGLSGSINPSAWRRNAAVARVVSV